MLHKRFVPGQHADRVRSHLDGRSDTGSAGRLVFHVFAALAEFERNLIRERTFAVLKTARARGCKGGPPAK